MNFDAYWELTEEQRKDYQSPRKCNLGETEPCGEPLVYVNGHSAGDLHVMCPKCRMCPDCEDGE